MYRQKGFSLIEVVVASVLLALISAGIFSITLSSRRLIGRSHIRYYAAEVGQTVFEKLRSYLGADCWDNVSSPIYATGAWGPGAGPNDWYYLTGTGIHDPDPLGVSLLFNSTEFATRYHGRWRYKGSSATGCGSLPTDPCDYREFKVEIRWDDPVKVLPI